MQLLVALSSSEFAAILIGGSVATAAALLISFLPARRGHWLAPALAIPGLLGGLVLFVVFAGPHSDGITKVIAAMPTLLAVGSLALWSRKKQSTRPQNRAGDEPKG